MPFSRPIIIAFASAALAVLLAGCSNNNDNGQQTTFGVAATDAGPPVGPPIALTLGPGETEVVTVTVELPDPTTREVGGDVMILFDRSGSFADDLQTFRDQSEAIVGALSATFPDLRVGLSSFVDANCADFGRSGDFGYELNLPLPAGGTDVAAALQAAINALDIRSGGDGPESQLEAMRQAMTGSGVVIEAENTACAGIADIPASAPGYDSTRVRFLLVSTDASFHDPTDVGSGGTPYPYPTTFLDVLFTADQTGTTIFFLNSGATDPDAEAIATETGGAIFDLGGSSDGVVEAIRDAIGGAVQNVEVRIEFSDSGTEYVQSITPEFQTADLTLDRETSFDVTFVGDSVAGTVDFDVFVTAGGAQLVRREATLTMLGGDR
jgi:hypothetical protein